MSQQQYGYYGQPRQSLDSTTVPLTGEQPRQYYKEEPYGQYSQESSTQYAGYGNNPAKSNKKRKWAKWGTIAFIVLACIIVACVVGGVVGTRNNSSDDSGDSSSAGSSTNNNAQSGGKKVGNVDAFLSDGGLLPSMNTPVGTRVRLDSQNMQNEMKQMHVEKRQHAVAGAALDKRDWFNLPFSFPMPKHSSIVRSTSAAKPRATQTKAVNEEFPSVDATTYYVQSTDQSSNPIYPTPSKTSKGEFVAPTASASSGIDSCDNDPYQFSGGGYRNEHPRIIAPQYKWDCLNTNIDKDSYLKNWDKSIQSLAANKAALPPKSYDEDGGLSGSGVLDVAREVQVRVRSWAYTYKRTGDHKWVDRTWQELQVASGNTSTYYGPDGDNWNHQHFLDTGEFTIAFAIAYDWMYDAWTDDQRTAIAWSIANLGLQKAIDGYGDGSAWWNTEAGNWNCVSNGGMIIGALAIINEDPTGGRAQTTLDKTLPNFQQHCMQAVYPDGTWTETPNYWYFGTSGMVEAISALQTATGSDKGMPGSNPNLEKTGLFHMWTMGNEGLFSYGDHGPNKYTATANALLFFGRYYDNPLYTLYQRDRADAGEPYGLFYYQPAHTGSWWESLALDHYFNNSADQWVGFRSSWSDINGVYFAMKASKVQGHQTHGDLDAGDFTFDAMGERWAGELGSANYLSPGYFSSEGQNSQRWLYYRKRTEGQNTIVIDGKNQIVTGAPKNARFESTNDAQESISYTPANSSTAYMVTDLSSFYSPSTVKRGVRLLNGRKQVLIQDEVNANASLQWRFHTNATVSANGNEATLTQNGKTLKAHILSPAGATFYTQEAKRMDSDPSPPEADQPNPGVTVVTIGLDAGQNTIQVLFNPQWAEFSSSDFVTPPSVDLDSWSLDSHN